MYGCVRGVKRQLQWLYRLDMLAHVLFRVTGTTRKNDIVQGIGTTTTDRCDVIHRGLACFDGLVAVLTGGIVGKREFKDLRHTQIIHACNDGRRVIMALPLPCSM